MKKIAQKKPMRKWIVDYELGDPDWGFMARNQAETMAVSEAKARSNILYRVSMGSAVRILGVREAAEV